MCYEIIDVFLGETGAFFIPISDLYLPSTGPCALIKVTYQIIYPNLVSSTKLV